MGGPARGLREPSQRGRIKERRLDFLIGDKLRVWDERGFFHYGIVVQSHPLNTVIVAHNSKDRGVELARLEAFSGGGCVVLESRVAGGPETRREVVARALTYVGKGYDLLNFNCEHYASLVQSGRPSSPQLAAIGFAALAVAAIVVLSTRRT